MSSVIRGGWPDGGFRVREASEGVFSRHRVPRVVRLEGQKSQLGNFCGGLALAKGACTVDKVFP